MIVMHSRARQTQTLNTKLPRSNSSPSRGGKKTHAGGTETDIAATHSLTPKQQATGNTMHSNVSASKRVRCTYNTIQRHRAFCAQCACTGPTSTTRPTRSRQQRKKSCTLDANDYIDITNTPTITTSCSKIIWNN